MFDTLMVFLKENFQKVDFEKNQQITKFHSQQRVFFSGYFHNLIISWMMGAVSLDVMLFNT